MTRSTAIFTSFFLIAVLLLMATDSTPLLYQICSKGSDLFIRFLKLLCIPIIFFSIATTISDLSSLKDTKHDLLQILTYTLLTTVVSALIGLLIFLVVLPDNSQLGHTLENQNAVVSTASLDNFLTHVESLVPTSLLEPFISGNIISVVFLAFLLGWSATYLPRREKHVFRQFLSTGYTLMITIVQKLVKIMPFIALVFIILLIHDIKDMSHVGHLILYLAAIVAANLIQALIVLPSLLFAHGISVKDSFRGILPALTLAFFSKSTSASLPLSMQCAEENLGVKKNVSRFTFPICTAINMNGCAAFILVTSLFILRENGIPLEAGDYVLWVFIATVAAIGNAGIPMGCFFLTTAILTSMNINVDLLGAIFPFYMLLDMLESAVNLWSDTCVTLIVNKKQGDLATQAAPAKQI
jgi:Na+/H+-dicarboxylate symporter